jgi:hypothetical protein
LAEHPPGLPLQISVFEKEKGRFCKSNSRVKLMEHGRDPLILPFPSIKKALGKETCRGLVATGGSEI